MDANNSETEGMVENTCGGKENSPENEQDERGPPGKAHSWQGRRPAYLGNKGEKILYGNIGNKELPCSGKWKTEKRIFEE